MSLKMNNISQQIYDYWFNGKINDLYKNKWFSGKNRQSIDTEITQLFKDNLLLVQDLNNDHIIIKPYKKTPISYVCLIVLLDQFSRHIYRNSPEHEEQIIKNTNKAVEFAKEMINSKLYSTLDSKYIVFMLLPLRHSKIKENIILAQTICEETKLQVISHLSYCQDNIRLYDKFLNATAKQLEHIDDNKGPKHSTNEMNLTDGFTEQDILEFGLVRNIKIDESKITQHRIYKSMESFIKNYKNPKDKYVIVSLSGGVDSMVIMKVLTLLESQYGFKTVAIHIDYGNRSESHAESLFLKKYCHELGVIFELVNITHIKRGITKRQDYERESRQIRFSTYQKMETKYNCSGIYLGHHKGDIQENILSNLMRGNTILNLAGMNMVSIINKSHIVRPLLNDKKSFIFDFSHKYNIPYFRDTTPVWSTRGKIRNKLLPLLKEIYGEGVMEKLSSAAEESSQIKNVIDPIIEPMLKNIQEHKIFISFSIDNIRKNDFYLWKNVLTNMFYKINYPRTNDKTIHILIDQINKNRNGWIVFSNKSNALYINNQIIIFKKSYINKNFPNHINCQLKDYICGPYKIDISKTSALDNTFDSVTWDILGNCHFSYDIKTSFEFNIECRRNTKMIGTSSANNVIRSIGFPSIITTKKKKTTDPVVYRITYSLIV